MSLTDSLVEWLKTVELNHNFNCAQDLCDGVIVANILAQIMPDFFSSSWLSKIDTDFDTDWRRRESNLRKVCEKLYDYFRENLDKEVPDCLSPNVSKIAMFFDDEELALLLQLVLGCAINGPNKNYFFEIMKELKVEVQEGLKTAIENLDYNLFDHQFEASFHSARQNTSSLMNSSGTANDMMALRSQELEEMVHNLSEENAALKELNDIMNVELNKFKARTDSLESQAITDRQNMSKLKQNVDLMRDELLSAEESKERVRAKYGLLEIEVKNLRQENSDLKYSKQNNDDKDRIRYLEEELLRSNEKYQLQVTKYEEMKTQRTANSDSLHQNESKETESLAQFRSENQKLKKQLQELRVKIGEEIYRADRAEDSYKRTNERCLELISDNDKYLNEIQQIKSEMDSYRRGADLEMNFDDFEFGRPVQSMPLRGVGVEQSVKSQTWNTKVESKHSKDRNNSERKIDINESTVNSDYMAANDVESLKRLLVFKDKQINELNDQHLKSNLLRETEARLMTIAFNKLSVQMQRKASEERLKKSFTFMSRQRQSPRMHGSSIMTTANQTDTFF